MILSGLTSNTFTSFAAKRIIELCQAAGLSGIEWQQRPHVPLGDYEAAAHTRAVTEEAGIVVISYAVDEPLGAANGISIPEVVQTTTELGAAALRVRAGERALSETGAEERQAVADRLAECVQHAEKRGLLVAVDLHPDSLAPSGTDALELMSRAKVDTAHVFWSPQHTRSVEDNVEDLRILRDSVLGLHGRGMDETVGATMLSELTDRWARYLSVLREVDDDHWFCLRGVEDETVGSFFRDAQTLRRLASKYGEV